MGGIFDNQGSAIRTEGNPNSNGADREISRTGTARTLEDIPKQDTVAKGRIVHGNVDQKLFKPTTDETHEAYKLAPA